MIIKFKLFEGSYPHEDPMGIYKIGDIVRYKKGHFKGKEGTVIAFFSGNGDFHELLIKHDKIDPEDSYYFCKGDRNEDPDKMSNYAKYNDVELVETNIPVKIRWYKKGKLEEGIRWYKKGKLEKPEEGSEEKSDCKHEWVLKQMRMLNRENYNTYMKYWMECRLCGVIEDEIKPKSKVKLPWPNY